MKILIIGHGTHGKDETAKAINAAFGLTFTSSSEAASDIFIYDALKDKYGYTSPEECYKDRRNKRAEWYNLICEYNKHDKARLAKEILKRADIYVGMRDNEELEASKELFDLIIGVYDPRKPLEPATSFNIDMWLHSDIIISNAGTLQDLKSKVEKLPIYADDNEYLDPIADSTAATNIHSIIADADEALLSEADRKRVREIKKMSLRIGHACLKEIYNYRFGE